MTIGRPLALAAMLAAASGCDLAARPAGPQEQQVIRATMVQLAEQARMIDLSICLDWVTGVSRDHVIFPNLWERAQFSDPVWLAYARARLPTEPVRVPGSRSPEGVKVRSALRNALFCRGWRTKLHTPLFSGPYAYVVAEDAMIFSIYAFVRDKEGWRVIRFGTARKRSIVV